MNQLINRRFDLCESTLLESPVVRSYEIVRRLVALTDGKLRIRVSLTGGDFAEVFEYVVIRGGTVEVCGYSYHWQDASGRLRKRCDNAPHFSQLPNAPHHVHLPDETVIPNPNPPDLFMVMKEIEQTVMNR